METLFLFINALFFAGTLAAIIFWNRPHISSVLSCVFTFLASLCGLMLSLYILGSKGCVEFSAPRLIPWVDLSFRLDSLSSFFILVISLLSLAFALYSLGYNREYYAKGMGILGPASGLFLLSMILVVSVNNALAFLIVWEVMALVSYLLVVSTYDKEESVKAGFVYIVMTHVGTALIIIAFLLLYRFTGSFDFDVFRNYSVKLPSGLKNTVFILLLLGFGTKAGIVPLHIWLPRAHPAAPSSISALMSGVMIKTAIYGMVRFMIDILGGDTLWWGGLILLIACVSAFLGVLYALMEHDIKRLLAYHSVENIGIILLGVGAAIIFKSAGNKQLAALALVAGLFHVLNHAVFKSLLFMGAGSVVYSTHVRNIEELGGLIKKMPWTALFFLIGSLSISALPPFNGFVSEWLTFQVLLLGFNLEETWLRIFLPLCAVVLGFVGALAAACFVKAFGITFLALPRSHHAQEAHESPLSMRSGMGILAALCLILGVFPQVLLPFLNNVAQSIMKVDISQGLVGYKWLAIAPLNVHFASISPLIVLLFLLLFLLATVLCLRLAGTVAESVVETWGCGIPSLTSRMEYTATAFSKPFQVIFRSIYRPSEDVERMFAPLEQPHFGRIKRYRSAIEPIFEKYLYEPMARFVMLSSEKVRLIQAGNIQLYLTYIFVTLILLLFLKG